MFARSVRPAAMLCLAFCALACSSSTSGTDLGVVEPGCRAPSACYKLGADCACARGDVESSCRVCDPRTQDCICPAGSQCRDAATVCVGRAAAVCQGTGARCLPAGASCATAMSGSPPQLVGTGAMGGLEPRCAFVDDVCCPGLTEDLGGVD
jgi:hypothetical protein